MQPRVGRIDLRYDASLIRRQRRLTLAVTSPKYKWRTFGRLSFEGLTIRGSKLASLFVKCYKCVLQRSTTLTCVHNFYMIINDKNCLEGVTTANYFTFISNLYTLGHRAPIGWIKIESDHKCNNNTRPRILLLTSNGARVNKDSK